MAERRYYWLKLYDDFFKSKRIKKLRKLAGGDTFTIIYLKMQLMAMKHGGVLEYTGLEDTFAKELALDLDEDEDNVDITVRYLLSCGLLETSDHREFFVPYAVANTGSEGSSTKRVREYRERQALQCNTDVTPVKQIGNGEIEKEIEIEKETEIECKARAKRFTPPTLEEVEAYCRERGNRVDPERFLDYYTSNGWKVGKNTMKDWKAAVRTWEKSDKQTGRKDNGFQTSNPFLEMLQEERGL
jgi:predicted phage replisome organizer